jgi:hypothetical protein
MLKRRKETVLSPTVLPGYIDEDTVFYPCTLHRPPCAVSLYIDDTISELHGRDDV